MYASVHLSETDKVAMQARAINKNVHYVTMTFPGIGEFTIHFHSLDAMRDFLTSTSGIPITDSNGDEVQ